MSQDKDLSTLTPVAPDPGKYQWVKGKVTGTDDKQQERMRIRRLRWLASAVLVLGLGACAQSGSPSKVWPAVPAKPPAPPMMPQVAYRIDEHRYFEITPGPDGECAEKMLYFVDTAKGIRSKAVLWDNVMTRGNFIIDAANDQYLVAPVTRGGTNCSSGGGACGGEKMPYSTDGGRTWQRVQASTNHDTMISGSMAYQATEFIGYSAPGFDKKNIIRKVVFDGIDLSTDITITGGVDGPRRTEGYWKRVQNFTFRPRIAPVDTKVQCKAQDSGSSK